jgi:SAM-dependent methyltransferase
MFGIVSENRMTSAADNIIGLYQRHGRAWAQDRGNRLVEGAWLDRFRDLLSASASILDLGCGSGEPIGRYFIEHGCHLTGIDSSPPLIELCQRSFPSEDWRIADMRTLSIQHTHSKASWPGTAFFTSVRRISVRCFRFSGRMRRRVRH